MALAGALFVGRAGVPVSHIPYRGGGPAMNGVMAGQVPLFFANVASAPARCGRWPSRPRSATCSPAPRQWRPRRSSERIERLAAAHGVQHLVLVQPSVYGTDNTVLLDALAARLYA